ncbi:MAG TPA: hypothetical protein VFW50_04705 [Streptosporangiaceae bacterium]|nr:hypothetical protein [Streptosporangiaceae bacterium]
MNPGDSVHDASRTRLDEASGPGAAAGEGSQTPEPSPGIYKPLQDIQDLIDKLAAVSRQLRHPHGGVASGSN